MKLNFNTPKDLCVAFRNAFYGNDSDRKLYILPYNRFDADSISNWWWLAPVCENPANKYGKFLFCMENDDLFAGLHIEKGLSEAFNVSGTPYNGMGMGSDWEWHKFIHDMQEGTFSEHLNLILEKSNQKPLITISYFSVAIKSIKKTHTFLYEGDSKITSSDGEWEKIAHITNTSDLSSTLIDIACDENTYFDINIGLTFKTAEIKNLEWSLVDLYEKHMQYLEKWVTS